MPDKPITILYDHYKDTCSIIRDAIKKRDRLMFSVVLVLAFFTFQAIFPTVSDTVVNDFLNFKFGLTLKLNLLIIGNMVWFLLLIFALRYFQVAVFIERQYFYIHSIEERLNKEVGENVITRESKSYLQNYPLFSDWMWILYTIIFPSLLFLISAAKIISEFRNIYVDGLSYGILLNIVAFILLAVSITLYMIMLHKK